MPSTGAVDTVDEVDEMDDMNDMDDMDAVELRFRNPGTGGDAERVVLLWQCVWLFTIYLDAPEKNC